MRPEFGMGLQGVIAARAGVVSGILNGVDTGVWSPEAEPVPYSVTAMKGKAANRAEICAEFGLDVPGPLAILVSRLTDQKGIDLLAGTIPDFIAGGGGLIVLGSGDPALEGAVLGLQARHGGRVAVRIGYDEALSHRLFAGGGRRSGRYGDPCQPCGLGGQGGDGDRVSSGGRGGVGAGLARAVGALCRPRDLGAGAEERDAAGRGLGSLGCGLCRAL